MSWSLLSTLYVTIRISSQMPIKFGKNLNILSFFTGTCHLVLSFQMVVWWTCTYQIDIHMQFNMRISYHFAGHGNLMLHQYLTGSRHKHSVLLDLGCMMKLWHHSAHLTTHSDGSIWRFSSLSISFMSGSWNAYDLHLSHTWYDSAASLTCM